LLENNSHVGESIARLDCQLNGPNTRIIQLNKYKVGLIPTSKTVYRCASALQAYWVEKQGKLRLQHWANRKHQCNQE
jgi:hypothetical protein